jgi:hypothetical protein
LGKKLSTPAVFCHFPVFLQWQLLLAQGVV